MKLKSFVVGLVALPVMLAGCSCGKDGEYVEVDKMEAFSYINEVKSDNNFNMEGYNFVLDISMPGFGSIGATTEGTFVIGQDGIEAKLEMSMDGVDQDLMGSIYIDGNTIYVDDGVTKTYASIPVGQEDLYSYFYGENGSANAIPSFEEQILTTLEQMENAEGIDSYVMTKKKEGTTTYKFSGDLESLNSSEFITFEGATIEMELTFKDNKLINATYEVDLGIMKTTMSFERFSGTIDFPSFEDYIEDYSVLDDYYIFG